ncbi:MAG TPA: RNA methyltransferase [Candidatus Omnitrophota bacterium]|nr:RNA methyltransferase [Candidatus Omnitrophota bacterium]HPS36446.1 RNA methyltransferase [Candidatus Omnitrophota bacterium]
MRKLSHPELQSRQTLRRHEAKLPFCVVLNNIRSLYNVGSVFRTADGAGVEKLWICGITGFPPDAQISKTALGAEKEVPWEYRKDPRPLLRELREKGYEIVLLEQVTGSISYEQYEPKTPACLVIGNEIEGVSDELLSLCDRTVEIDMAGLKNSLNVTVAFGIVAYHMRNRILTGARRG